MEQAVDSGLVRGLQRDPQRELVRPTQVKHRLASPHQPLAQALGASKPMKVPAWLARLLAGGYGVTIMTEAQGATNARAKRELGWSPKYASWREGFRTALD